ncbi:MAG: hypothetical protein LBS03_02720 [Bacteroidales bacterium]|jgi:hypothetical protein|nr:hypothetical protein [Bacteroidales bacterium]
MILNSLSNVILLYPLSPEIEAGAPDETAQAGRTANAVDLNAVAGFMSINRP